MSNKGRLFIIAGPSGSGKGTLTEGLTKRVPYLFLSVSATTRKPRSGEKNGIDYYFINEKEFQRHIDNDDFLEWATLYGHRYGTFKETVYDHLNRGIDVILEIDIQGARQVKKNFRNTPVFVFIMPPSLIELEKRLKERQTETNDALRKRLGLAKVELEAAGEFDHVIVNDDLNKAIDKLVEIVVKCRESEG